MEGKLIKRIKFFKRMVRGYEESIGEGEFDPKILIAKRNTLKMVIEDLEKLVGDNND